MGHGTRGLGGGRHGTGGVHVKGVEDEEDLQENMKDPLLH